MAQFLRHAEGISKVQIGELLGKKSAFYQEVAVSFFSENYDVVGMELDQALRTFLTGNWTLHYESVDYMMVCTRARACYAGGRAGGRASGRAAGVCVWSISTPDTPITSHPITPPPPPPPPSQLHHHHHAAIDCCYSARESSRRCSSRRTRRTSCTTRALCCRGSPTRS